jgi:Spy/CpxP family protein refolding chaperone
MGMAKAAELNGYPGPTHVLALAKQLSLTEDQLRRVQLAFDRMNAAARPLGEEVIAHEQTLDRQFAEGRADHDSVTAETAAIGELRGRLCSVHLAAHLEMRTLLTPDQIANYLRLRRYGTEPSHQHHHSGQGNRGVNFKDLTKNIPVMTPLGQQLHRGTIVEPPEGHPRAQRHDLRQVYFASESGRAVH